MQGKKLLFIANSSLVFSLVAFLISIVLAYGFESHLPLMLIAVLHVIPLFLAAIFKLSYVLRMIAQKQLGLVAG